MYDIAAEHLALYNNTFSSKIVEIVFLLIIYSIIHIKQQTQEIAKKFIGETAIKPTLQYMRDCNKTHSIVYERLQLNPLYSMHNLYKDKKSNTSQVKKQNGIQYFQLETVVAAVVFTDCMQYCASLRTLTLSKEHSKGCQTR